VIIYLYYRGYAVAGSEIHRAPLAQQDEVLLCQALATHYNHELPLRIYRKENSNSVKWKASKSPGTYVIRLTVEHHAQSDQLRLESIKQQILSKLGLTRKPNVSHPLPKQFIWDTIYRADGINSFSDFTINHHHISQHRMHDLLRVFSVFNTNLRKQQRASPILKVNKKSLEDFVNKKKSKHDQHHYHPHNNNSNNNDKILKYQHAHTTNMLNYNTTTATITNPTTITNRTTTINPKSIHQLQHERHEGSQHLQYQPKNRLQYIHYRQQQQPPQQTLKHNNKNTINNNMKYKLPKIRHRSSESNNNNRYNDRRTFTYLTDISSDDSLTINYDNNFDKEDVEDNDSTLKYHHYVNEMNADTNSYADEDNEDFFGSTQEIITFAEKEPCSNHTIQQQPYGSAKQC
uniref:Uncharacterized protein n=1 Tax=Glossina austeni TaxID=7395 RepID=A0A1A9UID1_GLOAU